MKPPDEVRQDLVQRWLKKAEEDLAVANLLLADDAPYYAAIGFHAQQAAEKFIEAFSGFGANRLSKNTRSPPTD